MIDLDKLRDARDALQPPAPITRDLICQSCGYNLRGLAQSASCPECGAPVSASLHGDDLNWAPINWLATVHDGLLMMAIAFGLLPLSLFAVGILHIFRATDAIIVVAVGILAIGCSAVLILGAFRMTTPEPCPRPIEGPITLRGAVRIMAALTSVAVMIYLLVALVPQQSPTRWSGLPDSDAERVATYGLVTIPILISLSLMHLRQFARRIPIERLARFTNIVIVGLPVSLSLFITLPSKSSIAGIGLIYTLSLITSILFSLCTICLVSIYAKVLDAPAEAARRNAARRQL